MSRSKSRGGRSSTRRPSARSGSTGSNRYAALLEPGFERQAQADHAGAERVFREVLDRFPQMTAARVALHRALVAQARYDEAVGVLSEGLRRRPSERALVLELAEYHRNQGDYAAAIASVSECLDADPRDTDALYLLAMANLGADRVDEGVEVLRRVLRHEPGHAAALLRLGQALHVLRLEGEAEQVFRRLLSLQPRDARAYHGLAHVLMSVGDLDEAHDCCRRALELDPTVPGASLDFARTRRFRPQDADEIASLNGLLGREDLSVAARTDASFAMGKVMDDLGCYEQAFEHYAFANRLVSDTASFDRAGFTRAIERTIETFSSRFYETRQGFGHDSRVPVFVVGMPRSGTTLVEQIIATHSKAHGADELSFIDDLARALPGLVGSDTSYPRCAQSLTGDIARDVADRYVRKVSKLGGKAERVVDKMPLNFLHLGFIASLFREARIIHCRRSPLDTCLSIYFQSFERGHDWAYDLGDIAFFFRGYARLMNHWRETLPVTVLEVSYEALVSDPEPVTRQLLTHCGLQWEAACLSPHRANRNVHSASSWQVRQPLYSTSRERWRHYEPWISPLRNELADLLPNDD